MTYRANYPATIAEVLDDTMTFKPSCLRAMMAFRQSKPWIGTVAKRSAKFQDLNIALATAYGLRIPELLLPLVESPGMGHGLYRTRIDGKPQIVLTGRLSVITYLHEFGHSRGYDERQAVRWSVNLFKKIFPQSFARSTRERHTVTQRPHNGPIPVINVPAQPRSHRPSRQYGFSIQRRVVLVNGIPATMARLQQLSSE